MDHQTIIRNAKPYLWVILLFVGLSVAYFLPDIFQDRQLMQADMKQGIAIGKELMDHLHETGDRSRWTNSLFGGMPSYQIDPVYDTTTILHRVIAALSLGLPAPASYIFLMLLGAFLMMKAFRVRTYRAALGAILYTFSSYFFIIIEAGHYWKLFTLTYIPVFLAGIIWAFRGYYLWGGVVAAIGFALQLANNHLQMTYYSLVPILAIGIWLIVQTVRQKEWGHFAKASAICVLAALLGIGANLSNLYHTWEYAQETMRGKSYLTPLNSAGETPEKTPEKTNKGGLSKEYITQWSYGKMESLTLLIPNIKGGATGALGADDYAMKSAKYEYRDQIAGMNHYWGDQPFTSGPVYVGAFTLLLALLALFASRSTLRYALLGAVTLALLLSWGKNLPWLTDLFIDYVPMYNKFRAVSSILVVVELVIPLLAVMGLNHWINNPAMGRTMNWRSVAAICCSAGVCLVVALVPSILGAPLSDYEASAYLPQAAQSPQVADLLDNLMQVRLSIVKLDALRSTLFIALGVALLLLFSHDKIKKEWLIGGVMLLTVIDMGGVCKRYMNSDNFQPVMPPSEVFPATTADEAILQDDALDYRVLNLTVNTFNEPNTSYHHKSVGGYHAAKLQRYQDLIERKLTDASGAFANDPEAMAVLNLLNTKYIIAPDCEGEPTVYPNTTAYGNAWFVERIAWAENADDEMAQLGTIDHRSLALMDVAERDQLNGDGTYTLAEDATAQITAYECNRLEYQTTNAHDGMLLLSEIYYPHGWRATVDGVEVPILRVNYLMRALEVPAGEHQVVLTFYPVSERYTEATAFVSMGITLLLMAAAMLFSMRSKAKGEVGSPYDDFITLAEEDHPVDRP